MYPEVVITWLDHWHSTDYMTVEECQKAELMSQTTHGYLFAENETMYIVTPTIDSDGRAAEFYFIAKALVKSLEIQKKKRTRKKKAPKIVDAGSDLRVLGSLPQE